MEHHRYPQLPGPQIPVDVVVVPEGFVQPAHRFEQVAADQRGPQAQRVPRIGEGDEPGRLARQGGIADPLKPTGREVRVGMLRQDAELDLEAILTPQVIGIEKGDQLPPGEPQPGVARGGGPRVGLEEVAYRSGAARGDRRGAIGRAIVHDDDLERTRVLPDGAGDRRSQVALGVEHRDDHAHAGVCGVHGGSGGTGSFRRTRSIWPRSSSKYWARLASALWRLTLSPCSRRSRSTSGKSSISAPDSRARRNHSVCSPCFISALNGPSRSNTSRRATRVLAVYPGMGAARRCPASLIRSASTSGIQKFCTWPREMSSSGRATNRAIWMVSLSGCQRSSASRKAKKLPRDIRIP